MSFSLEYSLRVVLQYYNCTLRHCGLSLSRIYRGVLSRSADTNGSKNLVPNANTHMQHNNQPKVYIYYVEFYRFPARRFDVWKIMRVALYIEDRTWGWHAQVQGLSLALTNYRTYHTLQSVVLR